MNRIEELEERVKKLEEENAVLRMWKRSAKQVFAWWDEVWEALGKPGKKGEIQPKASLRRVKELIPETGAKRTSLWEKIKDWLYAENITEVARSAVEEKFVADIELVGDALEFLVHTGNLEHDPKNDTYTVLIVCSGE